MQVKAVLWVECDSVQIERDGEVVSLPWTYDEGLTTDSAEEFLADECFAPVEGSAWCWDAVCGVWVRDYLDEG